MISERQMAVKLPWNKKYLEISFHVVITVAGLAAAGLVLFQLSTAKNVILKTAGSILAVFSPLLFAIAFSVLLEPMTAFFQKQYEKRLTARQKSKIQNRKAGTAMTYFSVIFFLILGGGWIVKEVGAMDMESLLEQLNGYIRSAGDLLVLFHLKLAELGILQNVEGILSAWIDQGTIRLQAMVMSFASSIPQIGGSIVDIIIGLSIAFYFLMEKNGILRFCREVSLLLLGEQTTRRGRRMIQEVNTVVMGYLGGQMTDALVMGTLFSMAFTMVKLPYGVVLGIVSGLSNLIPYFGAVMAFFLAIISGLLSGEPVRALYASILIIILQQIDSIVLVPRIVGKKVELHPVLVLLSLAIFGKLFGFVGLLVAVPLGALCKIFFCWCCEKKFGESQAWMNRK